MQIYIVPSLKVAPLIENFLATADYHFKAMQKLRERFGREDLLVQIYAPELLSIFMKNSESRRMKINLPALYDNLESKMRTRKFRENKIKMWRLPNSTGEVMSARRHSCGFDLQDKINTWNFLKKQIMPKEMVALARTVFGANHKKKKT